MAKRTYHINPGRSAGSTYMTHKKSLPESLAQKRQANPCLLYGAIVFWLCGIALLVASLVLKKSWLFLGCVFSGVLLIFGLGFTIMFWHFGKMRPARHIKTIADNGNKKVPDSITAQLEEKTARNKQREAEEEEQQRRTQSSTTDSTGLSNYAYQV